MPYFLDIALPIPLSWPLAWWGEENVSGTLEWEGRTLIYVNELVRRLSYAWPAELIR